jgi:2-iminobutanoate/2-iminopropanoate deaminase
MAFGADGTINGHDVVQQTGQVLANIDSLLRQHDLTRENVVKTTVWLRQRDDFWEFNRAYAEFFGTHRPSRSTVITDLAVEGAVVEIEATAFVGSPIFGREP